MDPTEHERGDPDAALAAADVKVEATYIAPAQLHNSMEPHAAVADWREDGLTLWSSTQAIYDARATVAEAFELDPERVRVICEFMGGGFGSKFGVGPQGILATELSRRTRPARAAREQPPRGEPRRRVPHAGAHGVHDRRVARRAPPGGRGIGRHGHGHRRLGLPRPRAREVGLHLPQPAADGRARPPEPRPVGRLPRPRRDGGHVRLRAGARRAGREARHRPARAAAAEPLRGRPREREALHVEAPLGVLRPGGRAGRLGRARRASRRRPHPPRDGRLEPVLVGRRRPARLRRGAGGQGRAARGHRRAPGSRHRHDDRLRRHRRRAPRESPSTRSPCTPATRRASGTGPSRAAR